jgi:RsiW-degrading membrane proteinase PrsW (M82 family)
VPGEELVDHTPALDTLARRAVARQVVVGAGEQCAGTAAATARVRDVVHFARSIPGGPLSRVRTLAATEILLVVGLVLFVGAAHLTERILGFDGPIEVSPPVAILMAVVPALLWMAYFYLQDRHEPEPKHFVLGVFLLGAFIAAPMSEFFIALAESPHPGSLDLDAFSPSRIVRAALVVGVAQELCKYLVVRYSIYLSPEFDEPMDGIIYMTAAGIGFATYENYRVVQGLEGTVFMATGAANAVVITLAHACFAGVLGYAMGRAKFSPAPPHRRGLVLLVGLVVAALLNGQFSLLESVVKTTGLHVQPWRGVAYAAGFAAIVFFVTSILMRRHLATSPHARAKAVAS